VRESLALRVTPAGTLLRVSSGLGVLVVTPNEDTPVETFIHDQIEGLELRVEVLFGLPPGARDESGALITPRPFRLVARLLRIGGRKAWSDRIGWYWFDRYLRSRRVNVVLAEYGPTGVELLDACRRNGLPLVTQFLGYDASHRPIVDSLQSKYRRLLREGTAAIAVSQQIERTLYEMGAPPGSVSWIPIGADLERFSATHVSKNPPTFLAIGRFVEKKAPHLTILAFRQVLDQVPDAKLWMVGDGPLLDACRQLVSALGANESIEFFGYQSHEALPPLMQRARAFVQHSVTAPSGDSEGTPVVILEAGASGLPVVSTRHGGIPEVVAEGHTGYLVAEGDIVGMANRMILLARDSQLAERLGAEARRRVEADFSLERTLDRLGDVLRAASKAADVGHLRKAAESAQR
jgi:glycosyltransferase involved in cell wall biosynthesis